MPAATAEARGIRNKNYIKGNPKYYYGNTRMSAQGGSKR